MAEKLDKSAIQRGLRSGKYQLVKFIPKPGRDPHRVWNTFREIAIVQEANAPPIKIKGFMACVYCKAEGVFAWSGKGGFKSPIHHINKQHTKHTNQPKISSKLQIKHMKNKHKDQITTACEDFILLDLRPFRAVEGEGFLRLCRTLINIGVELEHQVPLSEIKSAVPVGTTLSRRILKRESNLRDRFREKVQGGLKENPLAFSITFDGWTDKIRSRQWLGITLHFWNEDCTKIRCLYLACKEWTKCITEALSQLDDESIVENSENELSAVEQPVDVGINIDYTTSDEECDEEKEDEVDTAETGQNIKTAVRYVLGENGLLILFDNESIWIATDCGSNVTKAVKLLKNGHIKCINHRLNTCLQDAIKECINKSKTIKKGIKYSKKFVTKVKKAHKVKHFNPTLKQWVETRWTTLYDLFHSIYKNYDKCFQFCNDSEWKQHILIPKNQLKALCEFMLVVKLNHEKFQKRTLPTIQRVIPTIVSLLTTACKEAPEDGQYVKKLKAAFATALKAKCVPSLTIAHWKSVVLNPMCKAKKFSLIDGENFRDAAITEIKSQLSDMSAPAPVEPLQTPPKKKQKINAAESIELEIMQCDDDDDSDFDEIEFVELSEWDKYCKLKLDQDRLIEYNRNPMIFWNDNKYKSQYPNLSKIAKATFIIQASAAASESMFSFGGNILNKKRSQLGDSNVSALLFASSFMKLQITEYKEQQTSNDK